MENPIKMEDLGVPLFLETPIYTCHNSKNPKPRTIKFSSPMMCQALPDLPELPPEPKKIEDNGDHLERRQKYRSL